MLSLMRISFIALIREFDVNKDSKVTLQELLSGVEAKFIKTKSASALPGIFLSLFLPHTTLSPQHQTIQNDHNFILYQK